MAGTFTNFREEMLRALYQEQVHEGQDDMLSFGKLAEEYGLEWRSGWLDELQSDLRMEGLIRGPSNGVGDDMAMGKLNGAGLRYIEDKYGDLNGVPTLISKPAYDDLLVVEETSEARPPGISPSSAVHAHTATEPTVTAHPATVDSRAWTGKRLVLTDEAVLRDLRAKAIELREKVHSIRFESNSDSNDVKGLCDALVAITEMAEPDLTIIERILMHPKFQASAVLMAAVATVRGALGI